MKKIKKILSVFGMMVVMVGLLAGCSGSPSNDRSTPDEAMENYMKTVKAGNIEESHEFMHGAFLESYTDENEESMFGEELDEEIKETKGYKAYQKELKNIYKDLEYEITDTHEKEGFDQKEFTITLTMTDINKLNEEVLEEISKKYFEDIILSDEDEDIISGLDEMYGEFAKALKDGKDIKSDTSGHLIFVESGTEEDEFEREWVIAGMEYELFKRLNHTEDL